MLFHNKYSPKWGLSYVTILTGFLVSGRLALGPTQSPKKWVSSLFDLGKAAGA
jgi:hypothetical protein